MKTPAHDNFPEIEWQQGELLELHERIYSADGISEDGREWIGFYQGGEIFDIELKD